MIGSDQIHALPEGKLRESLMRDLSRRWRCVGCRFTVQLSVAVADIGCICCPGCGFTLLRPWYLELPPMAHHTEYAAKLLGDGRAALLHRMIHTWRIVLAGDIDAYTYDDGYCYKTEAVARAAFEAWDGHGEPQGWNKHLRTGRWREDGTPESEA